VTVVPPALVVPPLTVELLVKPPLAVVPPVLVVPPLKVELPLEPPLANVPPVLVVPPLTVELCSNRRLQSFRRCWLNWR